MDYTIVSPAELSYDLAERAHQGTSWTPDVRARQQQESYATTVQTVYNALLPLAQTEAQQAILTEEIARYKATYLSKLGAYLGAHSRVLSSFVIGSSNFPTARNQRRNDTADRRLADLLAWRATAEKAIRKALVQAGRPDLSPEAAIRQKIAQRTVLQDRMVAANKLIRKQDRAGLAALGFTETEIARLFIPDFAGRLGFADYQLTNNRAEIKRLEARLGELASRADTETTFTERTGAGWRMLVEDGRLCLDFDAKPDAATRTALKSRGFKWAPSRGMWVRQFTQAAIQAAEQVVGPAQPVTEPEPEPMAPVIADIPEPMAPPVVAQASMFDVPTEAPAMAQPARAPAQSVMLLGLAEPAADLASQIPADLLAVLAGYALAGLDANRQALVLSDLGTGRIVTKGALVARCKALMAQQTTEATQPFCWG